MNRIKSIVAWWGRKGVGFIIISTALIVGAILVSPANFPSLAMWLVGAYGVFAGSNAVVTIGTASQQAQAQAQVAPDPAPKPQASDQQEGS